AAIRARYILTSARQVSVFALNAACTAEIVVSSILNEGAEPCAERRAGKSAAAGARIRVQRVVRATGLPPRTMRSVRKGIWFTRGRRANARCPRRLSFFIQRGSYN